MSSESHCVPGAFPLLSLVRMGMKLSGWNCILGLLFVVCCLSCSTVRLVVVAL